jgi:hypothetical protein
MCDGAEQLLLDALVNKGNKCCRSLIYLTGSSSMSLDICLKDYLRKYVWMTDKVRSFLDVGQLRALWKKYYTCTSHMCRGFCASLPGDTIYWNLSKWGYHEAYMCTSATKENLIECGYVTDEFEGMLAHEAKVAREDQSKLKESP